MEVNSYHMSGHLPIETGRTFVDPIIFDKENQHILIKKCLCISNTLGGSMFNTIDKVGKDLPSIVLFVETDHCYSGDVL